MTRLTARLTLALFAGSLIICMAAERTKLSSDDTDFIKKAAQGGRAEVELGQLAIQKASDAGVKAFGSKMMRDHSTANNKLASLAASKAVDLPTGKGLTSDATFLKLKVLSGKTFDKAYVNAMVDDHKQDVADFEKESNQSQDPDVKAFAVKTLPTLRSHLETIEKLQASLQDK